MTRAELLTALGYELNKNSTLDTLTQNRLLSYLNQRHRRMLSAPGLQHLRDTVITFDSVASQSLYGIPNVAKINRIWDVANTRTLSEMSLSDYRAIDPRATLETGVSEAWVWAGYGAVAKQPSASILYAVSSSAADTTQTVRVEGVNAGNFPTAMSVTLTGVTPVALSPAIVASDVSKFYLSATTAGYVSLQTVSGSIIYAVIQIGQKSQRYYQFYLWRTPGAVVTYSADITRAITDLAQDTDEPLLPADFHDLLVLGAAMDEYRHLDDNRYGAVAQEYGRREREFHYWLHESASATNMMPETPSRLGGWFPAGT